MTTNEVAVSKNEWRTLGVECSYSALEQAARGFFSGFTGLERKGIRDAVAEDLRYEISHITHRVSGHTSHFDIEISDFDLGLLSVLAR